MRECARARVCMCGGGGESEKKVTMVRTLDHDSRCYKSQTTDMMSRKKNNNKEKNNTPVFAELTVWDLNDLKENVNSSSQ